MTVHRISVGPSDVKVGVIDNSFRPVLTVASGDEIVFNTLPLWAGRLGRGASLEELLEARKLFPMGPHSMTGPVAVRGARPGHALRVTFLEILPGPYGFNFTLPRGLGRGVLADDFPSGFIRHFSLDRHSMTTALSPDVVIPLRPFLGIVGVAPAEPGPHRSATPGPFGGNLDLPDLTVGSSILLPVLCPDALFFAGDGHAAQGYGEADQSGIEAGMERVRVRLDLVEAHDLRFPRAETPDHLIALGLHEDLDTAAGLAVSEMVATLTRCWGLTQDEAYACCSIAGDVTVTQLVNGVKGAHVKVAKQLKVGPMP